MSLQIAELCAGYGGLYMGLKALWPDAELNWYAEIDKAACRVLERHYPDAENQGDITQVDWGWLADTADIMAAGTPCQDISSAGKGAGLKGRRSRIVLDFLDGVGVVRPRAVLWENVKAATWRQGELHDESVDQTVSRQLQEMGYCTSTVVRSAKSVGAPHLRSRVFIWAFDPDDPLPRPRPLRAGEPNTHRLLPTPTVVDMGSNKTRDEWDEWVARMKKAHGNGNGHGRSLSQELCSRAHRYQGAVQHWSQIPGTGTPPPSQDAEGRLDPRFVEWMMGLPAGHVTGVPGLSRTAQLRLLGNGVVPLQAAAAVQSARRVEL